MNDKRLNELINKVTPKPVENIQVEPVKPSFFDYIKNFGNILKYIKFIYRLIMAGVEIWKEEFALINKNKNVS